MSPLDNLAENTNWLIDQLASGQVLPWVLGGAALLALVAVVGAILLVRKRRQRPPPLPDIVMVDLASVGEIGPPEDGPELRCYGLAVRLAVLVLAPAGRLRDVPGSVTAVTADTLNAAGVRIVSDAALFAPNVFFTEFTARKSSNPRFRGIGASPANPAVRTYIAGVPQLNVNSSSIELLDVSQIEFVRGPQSPLYGRNALGGVINVTSARPSLTGWTGSVVAPFGNVSSREVRAGVSGPLASTLGMSVSIGRNPRASRCASCSKVTFPNWRRAAQAASASVIPWRTNRSVSRRKCASISSSSSSSALRFPNNPRNLVTTAPK